MLRQGKKKQKMTEREADLLSLLHENRNSLTLRSDILLSLWGEVDYFLVRSLDVHGLGLSPAGRTYLYTAHLVYYTVIKFIWAHSSHISSNYSFLIHVNLYTL